MIVFESEDVIVQTSAIEGLGVFAKRNFKKGEKVLRWKPEREMSQEEFESMSPQERKYIPRLENGRYILMGIPERYINHSCGPNTSYSGWDSDRAVRDIKKGEEITSDYHEYLKSDLYGQHTCNCGSESCIDKNEPRQ